MRRLWFRPRGSDALGLTYTGVCVTSLTPMSPTPWRLRSLSMRSSTNSSGMVGRSAAFVALVIAVAACGARSDVRIHGTVRDAGGNPVAGARVVLDRWGSSTMTGSDGSFQLVVSQNESCRQGDLRVSAEGFGDHTVEEFVVAKGEDIALDLTLTRTASKERGERSRRCNGRITDPTLTPLKNVPQSR